MVLPNGLLMMLKTMMPGFNPEDIGRQVESVRAGASATIQHFNNRLSVIETHVVKERQADCIEGMCMIYQSVVEAYGKEGGTENVSSVIAFMQNYIAEKRSTIRPVGIQPGGAQTHNS